MKGYRRKEPLVGSLAILLLFCCGCTVTAPETVPPADTAETSTVPETETTERADTTESMEREPEIPVALTETLYIESLGKTLYYPESWTETALFQTGYTLERDRIAGFTLYEATTYRVWKRKNVEFEVGRVLYMFAVPVEKEDTILYSDEEKTFTPRMQAAIGRDETYIYFVGVPTDVQFLMETTIPFVEVSAEEIQESQENYSRLQEESKYVLAAFLTKNDITINEQVKAMDEFSVYDLQIALQMRDSDH